MTALVLVVTACLALVVATEADDRLADTVAAVLARWPRTVIVFQTGWAIALGLHLLTEAPSR